MDGRGRLNAATSARRLKEVPSGKVGFKTMEADLVWIWRLGPLGFAFCCMPVTKTFPHDLVSYFFRGGELQPPTPPLDVGL